MITKGTAGPSGMDADVWRKILCSNNFKMAGKDLREEIAILGKNISTKSFDSELLECYSACKLLALDKNPWIRPIGVGEVIKRIIGKALVVGLKRDLKDYSSPLQVSSGYEAGSEAAIHSMKAIFEDDQAQGIILVDARNAFNTMNRKVALQNIRIIFPVIAPTL